MTNTLALTEAQLWNDQMCNIHIHHKLVTDGFSSIRIRLKIIPFIKLVIKKNRRRIITSIKTKMKKEVYMILIEAFFS
jgi:hypothetical protein